MFPSRSQRTPVFYDDTKQDDADNAKEKNAKYWYYDSSKASLYLKQDKGDGKYYLESPKDKGKPTTHANSKNINPSSGATHGFSRLTNSFHSRGVPIQLRLWRQAAI